jgi:hypothetical protein
MSFTGRIDAKCPGCGEENSFEIWSFVRGDQDETLKDRLKGGELNVLECPNCGRLFYPETSWIYADPRQALIAFVFPESFAPEEERWREKMHEDFERMKPVAEKIGIHEEPLIFFGAEPLARLIHSLEDLEDESMVAGWFCKELGLSTRTVEAGFARQRRLPRELPFAEKGRGFTTEGALAGLKQLVERNDRLEGYRRWIEYFEAAGGEPPWEAKA